MDRRRDPWIASALFLLAAGCQGLAGVEYRELTPCTPAAQRCDGFVRRICAEDGSRWEDAPCDPDRPFCSGAGECVLPGPPTGLWEGTPADFSCAHDDEGHALCWGKNDAGQLGIGSTDDVAHPTPVALPVLGVNRLALGAQFGCALLQDGSVDCWGKNDFGQARGGPGATALLPTTVPVPGIALQIATGANHACVLLEDATVQCWGSNVKGQLGDGTLDDRATPAPVLADPSTVLAGVTQLALGSTFSCALRDGGDLWCWGDNLVIGVGGLPGTTPLPVLVRGGVTEVSAGTDHTCAIVDGDEVWCWGLSINGETADPLPTAGENEDVTAKPFHVEAATGSTHVSAAFRHTCAAHADGVWCWGGDFWGQLGDGSGCAQTECEHGKQLSPVPVQGLGMVDDLATGFIHSCVISPGGAAACWGPNAAGQLGDGSTHGADVPTPVLWPQ